LEIQIQQFGNPKPTILRYFNKENQYFRGDRST